MTADLPMAGEDAAGAGAPAARNTDTEGAVSATDNPVTRSRPATNGTAHLTGGKGKTRPRRVVLLEAGEHSAVERVLAEFTGSEGSGKDAHAQIERHATNHAGRCVAAEWLGPLGWTRFLWCRKK